MRLFSISIIIFEMLQAKIKYYTRIYLKPKNLFAKYPKWISFLFYRKIKFYVVLVICQIINPNKICLFQDTKNEKLLLTPNYKLLAISFNTSAYSKAKRLLCEGKTPTFLRLFDRKLRALSASCPL